MRTTNSSGAHGAKKATSFNTDPDGQVRREVDRHNCEALSFTICSARGRPGDEIERAPAFLPPCLFKAMAPRHLSTSFARCSIDLLRPPIPAAPRRMRVADSDVAERACLLSVRRLPLRPAAVLCFPVRITTSTSLIGNGPGRTQRGRKVSKSGLI